MKAKQARDIAMLFRAKEKTEGEKRRQAAIDKYAQGFYQQAISNVAKAAAKGKLGCCCYPVAKNQEEKTYANDIARAAAKLLKADGYKVTVKDRLYSLASKRKLDGLDISWRPSLRDAIADKFK